MATPETCKRLPDPVEVGLERSRAGDLLPEPDRVSLSAKSWPPAALPLLLPPHSRPGGDVGGDGSGAGIVEGTAATVMKSPSSPPPLLPSSGCPPIEKHDGVFLAESGRRGRGRS